MKRKFNGYIENKSKQHLPKHLTHQMLRKEYPRELVNEFVRLEKIESDYENLKEKVSSIPEWVKHTIFFVFEIDLFNI